MTFTGFEAFSVALGRMLTTVKSVLETHVKLKTDEVASSLQWQIIDLQTKLIGLHQDQMRMLSEKIEAERKLAAYQQWDVDLARYEIKAIGSDVFAYALRPDRSNGEPPHQLCLACVSSRIKTVLQKSQGGDGVWSCPHNPDHNLATVNAVGSGIVAD